jgi:phospholipase/carboxylesterase
MNEPAELIHRTRPPAGEPEGLIVLFHGRGADEHDLFPLFDVFDPSGRFLGVSPRGPLSLPPGGAHWYVVQRVGYPDPSTFDPTYERASAWLDAFVAKHGLEWDRVVLGGFSQGAVMSYALGLGKDRPSPAAIAAFSGFIPRLDGFDVDFDRPTKVMVGHGTQDPVINVSFGRDARDRLTEGGIDLVYREYPLPHTIEPGFAREVGEKINDLLSRTDPAPR